MMRLGGKISLVTGAGSGIGAATARRLAAEGSNVVLTDINPEAAARIAAEIPGSRSMALDVASSAQVDAIIADVVAREGRLDIVVHSAGVDDVAVKKRFAEFLETGVRLPVGTEITDAQWDRMMRVNLSGTFFVLRAAAKAMLPNRSGAIACVSSISAIEGVMGYGHYSASKAGMLALVHSFAKEFIEWGIRFNAVAPDPVKTPMSAPTPASLIPKLPIGRYAEPEEIAAALVFLVSDDASYISGETLILAPGRVTI